MSIVQKASVSGKISIVQKSYLDVFAAHDEVDCETCQSGYAAKIGQAAVSVISMSIDMHLVQCCKVVQPVPIMCGMGVHKEVHVIETPDQYVA